MNWIETWMISCGLSFDVCGLMICKGAVLARLNRGKVACVCAVFADMQMAALLAGNLISLIFPAKQLGERLLLFLRLAAVLIFVLLGLYMLRKAWRNEPILERRKDELGTREIVLWAWAVSQDAFLAGLGFSFLQVHPLRQILSLGVVTVLAVLAGLQIGFHLGYEQKTKSYAAGGALLLASGIEIAVRYLR